MKEGQGQFITMYDRYPMNFKDNPKKDGPIGIGIASAIVYSSVVLGWLYIAFLGFVGLYAK